MLAVLSLSVMSVIPAPPSAAATFTLPVGRADLIETRTTETLAPGVTLTRIVRGLLPTTVSRIGTTSQGPWRVNVLSIDPRLARGHVRATYGGDLARTERVTDLVRLTGAVAGVNSSFFHISTRLYPGEPRGLGLYGGEVLSEPAAVSTEVNFVIDAKTSKVTIGRLSWTGTMRNRSTEKTLALEYLNHPPVVPRGCTKKRNQTSCNKSGDVVHFAPAFARSTPSGHGVEVVLDRRGCRIRTLNTRGTALAADQTSVQATGRQTKNLLKITKSGCLSRQVRLYDEAGKRLRVTERHFGVAGRYRLTKANRIVAPAGSGGFVGRHPRTFAGRKANGTVVLASIDGRQTTSVGATLAETARIAHSLGLVDSVNLDGGGSTAMSVRGALANRPSGLAERAVGDSLVYVDRQFS